MVVTALLLAAGPRASYAGRHGGPVAGSGRGGRAPGDLPALAATRSCCVLVVAARSPSLVVASLRVDGAWSLANYRALQTPGSHQALLVPVTDALVNSLRIAVDATWMSLLLGLSVGDRRHPPLAHPRPSAGCAASSTGSSCCRSGSPR